MEADRRVAPERFCPRNSVELFARARKMTGHEHAAARHRLSRQLLGIDGGWVDMCREALAEGTLASLECDSKTWDAFESEVSGPFLNFADEDSSTLVGPARAVLSLARALAGEEPAGTAVLSAMERFDRSGLGSPSGYRPSLTTGNTARTKLEAVLVAIEKASPDHPSAAFTSLLARYLSGEQLKGIRTVEVPVLFDQMTGGSVGRLRINEIRQGPPGVHPSPRSMVFFAGDQAFVQAMRDAWAISPKLRSSQRSFMWELIDQQERRPLRNVSGSSLGAAWYVAFDALKYKKFLALKSLDPHCAATGALDNTALASVTGYDNKFRAAASNNLRVVYPAVDFDEADPAATHYAATATPAKDAAEAVKAVRTRTNRKGIVVWAIITVLASALMATLTTQLEAANAKSTAANLLIKAGTLRNSDPRLAGLLSMASQKIAPSLDATKSMQAIADDNDMVAGSFHATNDEIWKIAASKGTVVVGTRDGHVIGFDTSTTEQLWSLQAPARDLAISPDGKTMALIDYYDNVAIYALSGKSPSLVRTEQLTGSNNTRQVTTLQFFIANAGTDGGPRLVAVTSSGIQMFRLDGVDHQDFLFRGSGEQGLTAVSASPWEHDFTLGDGLLIGFTNGTVQYWRPQQPSTLSPLLTSVQDYFVAGGLSSTSGLVTTASPAGVIDWTRNGVSSPSVRRSVNGTLLSMISLNQSEWDGTANYDVAVLGDNGLTVSGINDSFTLRRTDIQSISSIPNSSLIAAGTKDGEVLLIDPFNGNKGNLGYWRRIEAVYRNDVLAKVVYSSEDQVEKWSLDSLNTPHHSAEQTYVLPNNAKSRQIASVATNGEVLAALTYAGDIIVWNVKSAEVVQVLQPEDVKPSQQDPPGMHAIPGPIYFINRGKTLLVQGLSTSRFISTVDWKTSGSAAKLNIAGSPSSDGPVDAWRENQLLELDPSNGTVLSTVALQRYSTPEVLAESHRIAIVDNLRKTLTLRSPDGKEVIHESKFDSGIQEVSSSPTGVTLAVETMDGQVTLLDAATFDVISRLVRYPLGQVTWSADGKYIARGARLWPVEPQPTQAELCGIVGSDFTPAEWRTYIGESTAQVPLCP
ncbi:hypothetical protein PV772_19145 [Pseudarthrobacter sp. CC12]|uniref:outer membrane protein assembly factor BamB family protein n=1 Tax=Pseudarthrobacter sp. CC12 TaxID=3029193 RepID=UPI003263D140